MTGKITIRPSDNWRWYFDCQYDCLMLEISNDMVFRSRYPSRSLTPDAFCSFPFSVDDSTAYYHFYDSCSRLNLTEPQKVELALNAIVASHFLKPQMPKSWYFVQQSMACIPEVGEMVEAQVQDTGQRINLLTVEVGESASLCLISEPSVMMAGKEFAMTDTVKVMNDRLASKYIQLDHQQEAYEDENDRLINLFQQACS